MRLAWLIPPATTRAGTPQRGVHTFRGSALIRLVGELFEAAALE